MVWRANDVLVGVVTGVIVSLVAAGIELYFISIRVFSLGQHGGGLGSKFGIIAAIGAIFGGLVGLIMGALVRPKVRSR
jgi:membrane associated rhomboid family serine protease